MSFLKKLFGGGQSSGDATPKVLDKQEHKGFVIRAIEMRAGGEFQLCGEVEKNVGGEVKVHRFIRADRLPSADVAASATLAKGVQIIDEQGDRLFN
jgi:hypothetical protein